MKLPAQYIQPVYYISPGTISAKIVFVLFLIILSGLWSCTFNVQLNPEPKIDAEKKLNIDAGLIFNDQVMPYHKQRGLFLIGMIHTWKIETDAGLRLSAEKAMKQFFRNVETVNETGKYNNKKVTLFITPKITYFDVSQKLSAYVVVNCVIVDSTGKKIYDKSFSATGKEESKIGCLGGVFKGREALSRTSESAFNEVFRFLLYDIRKNVNFTPYIDNN